MRTLDQQVNFSFRWEIWKLNSTFETRGRSRFWRSLHFLLFNSGVCLPFNKGNELNLKINLKSNREKGLEPEEKTKQNLRDPYKSLNYVPRLLIIIKKIFRRFQKQMLAHFHYLPPPPPTNPQIMHPIDEYSYCSPVWAIILLGEGKAQIPSVGRSLLVCHNLASFPF